MNVNIRYSVGRDLATSPLTVFYFPASLPPPKEGYIFGINPFHSVLIENTQKVCKGSHVCLLVTKQQREWMSPNTPKLRWMHQSRWAKRQNSAQCKVSSCFYVKMSYVSSPRVSEFSVLDRLPVYLRHHRHTNKAKNCTCYLLSATQRYQLSFHKYHFSLWGSTQRELHAEIQTQYLLDVRQQCYQMSMWKQSFKT